MLYNLIKINALIDYIDHSRLFLTNSGTIVVSLFSTIDFIMEHDEFLFWAYLVLDSVGWNFHKIADY